MMPTRPRRALRFGAVATGTSVALAVGMGSALAYWKATGTGTGRASTSTINAPTSVAGNATTKLVTWAQNNTGAVTPTGFTAQRSSTTGTRSWVTVCTAGQGATSCTDTAAVSATDTFVFQVIAKFNSSWSATSAESATPVTYTVVSVGTPDLTAASDSGSSNTDNITNVTTPTFTVSAPSGSTVQLLDNGTPTGSSVTANSQGSATLTTGTLTGGAGTVHPISAKATQNGVTGTSSALNVTIDTQAPTVSSYTDTNGTTDGKFETGDTFTANFSEAIVTTWGSSTTGTVTLSGGNGSKAEDSVAMDQLASAAAGLGNPDYISGNNTATFAATYTYSAASTSITVTLGTCSGSCASVGTASALGTYVLTVNNTIKDIAGNAVTGTTSQSIKLF